MILSSELTSRLQILKGLIDLGDDELATASATRLYPHRDVGTIPEIIDRLITRRYEEAGRLISAILKEAEAEQLDVHNTFTNSLGMNMVWCQPGEFLMGSAEGEKERDASENQVLVKISQGFWIARTQLTQGTWQALMGSNPSYFTGNKELPVEQVSWNDALDFCAKLNAVEALPHDYRYTLPTEAQWEYACRAGSNTPFHFGNMLNGTEANCNGSRPYGTEVTTTDLGKTIVVGSYPSNSWGLHDMHGNVCEWCADWYENHLHGGPDPTGPATGTFRVFRGGAWLHAAGSCRAANRCSFYPHFRVNFLGFRPAIAPSK
jgi:sulfatase modifying factor 1